MPSPAETGGGEVVLFTDLTDPDVQYQFWDSWFSSEEANFDLLVESRNWAQMLAGGLMLQGFSHQDAWTEAGPVVFESLQRYLHAKDEELIALAEASAGMCELLGIDPDEYSSDGAVLEATFTSGVAEQIDAFFRAEYQFDPYKEGYEKLDPFVRAFYITFHKSIDAPGPASH